MKLAKITSQLNQLYPNKLACSWDNVGLLIGNENNDIKKIMTTLEITNQVVDEAIKKKVDLIVVHHPIIFKPLKSINDEKIIKLIKNNISVYVMHTNVDVCINGMNDWLADEIGLENIYELSQEIETKMASLSIKVSKDEIDRLSYILSPYIINLGAINNISDKLYNQGLYTTKIINNNDMLINVEANILASDQDEVIDMLLKKGYSDIKVTPITYPNLYLGIGRIGYIKEVKAISFARRLKRIFKTPIKIVGDVNKSIKKVAIVGGSGVEYMKEAKAKGCDCLLTGDIKYHDAHKAKELGIMLMDISHHAEVIFKEKMKGVLEEITNCQVITSSTNVDPFDYV